MRTTVGGYVLVTHANVSYITHHSSHQYDSMISTVSLPQTIQPTRLPPLLPLFLILLFSSAKWKQIWRCWYTSVGNKWCYTAWIIRPGQAGAAATTGLHSVLIIATIERGDGLAGLVAPLQTDPPPLPSPPQTLYRPPWSYSCSFPSATSVSRVTTSFATLRSFST